MPPFDSWGNYKKSSQEIVALPWRTNDLPKGKKILPRGQARSYGDVPMNDDGIVITSDRLNHLISFDKATGRLVCESGVTLAEILQLVVPHGWFLYVTPGTKFISIGGAIANDVHGKNHHAQGTFAHHLIRFELLRSDGSRIECSPHTNQELFSATIGGLGLTGLVTWAEIQLRKIASPFIISTVKKQPDLSSVIDELNTSANEYEYTIASLDNAARGSSFGRGVVIMGNHDKTPDTKALTNDGYRKPKITIPMPLPVSIVHAWNSKIFSTLYYSIQKEKNREQMHYEPFFYPQDFVENWNFFYGKQGFLQYQCLIPAEAAKDVLKEMLERIAHAGMCSPLTTLKRFGNKPSLGMLSWPKDGFSLALDFKNTGEPLLDLLTKIDELVIQAKGSLYPAKDARMSSSFFKESFPRWQDFSGHIDPAFSSNFWKRVTL